MSKVLQNNKATTCLGRVELFCLFVACSTHSWKLQKLVLPYRFSWVWSGMPKVLWSNKSIFLEKVMWFCWFFASSYLHLVRYPLKLQKYAILGWHGQIARCFKLKKLKKDMRYPSWFFASIETRRNIMHFGLWPQNTLSQSVCRILYFWFVWLVKLNTGGPLLHCTCLVKRAGINDLADGLASNARLFADGTSLFHLFSNQ